MEVGEERREKWVRRGGGEESGPRRVSNPLSEGSPN